MRRFRQPNQAREHVSELGVLRAAKGKINLAIEGVKLVVDGLRGNFRLKDFVGRADLVLCFLDGLENAGSEKSKNGGTEADDIARGNEYGPPQHIRVDLIENVVFLWNPAGVDDPA